MDIDQRSLVPLDSVTGLRVSASETVYEVGWDELCR